MLGSRARKVAKRVLPPSTQAWLLDRRNPRQFIGRTRIAPTLDRWAARWTIEAQILKTDDARNVTWVGRPIWQYPLDAWVLQEMIAHLKPDLIVETGTHRGGSAYFYATLLDLMEEDGEIISIDIAAESTMPHPRITYVAGSSTDPEIVADVKRRAEAPGVEQVLLILDSDHRAEHVEGELDAFASLVPVGGYVHVQDGCVDTFPLYKGHFPGPAIAAEAWLKRNPSFVRDLDIEERYVMSAHPFGWLRRIGE